MKIADIVIGERHRKDMGDLAELAESIRTEGLLQPIGITEGKKLVFGQRRLLACRDVLGWTEIPARMVNVTSILAGEYAENTLRKDFTPSERVAIAAAVKRELGERRGRPTENTAQGPGLATSGRETRDIAAAAAGFGSAQTLRRAEAVIAKGTPELVEAMDKGSVSIRAAAAVAELPDAEQRDVLREGRAASLTAQKAGTRKAINHLSKKASYKHPLIKLENAANTLETIAEGFASFDGDRAAEIPTKQLSTLLDRIAAALQGIRRHVAALRRSAA